MDTFLRFDRAPTVDVVMAVPVQGFQVSLLVVGVFTILVMYFQKIAWHEV